MLKRFLIAIGLICMLVTPALSEDEIGSDDGPVEVTPDTSESIVSVPIDEESGMVDWNEYQSLPDGGGASFGFVTTLYPPDPAALANCPDILLDGAWYPPIPFAYGFNPPTDTSFYTQGWWYLEDASGNLARRDMTITTDTDSWISSSWYVGGGWLYHLEQDWIEGFVQEGYYLPDAWSGPGIDYFIRSVWFNGVLGGERMQALLEECNAQRIGRDRMNGGRDRLVIYMVPASESDRQNGRGSLLVWLDQGSYRLSRTRLNAAYAIEVTDYLNVSIDVTNDPQSFYSDYLTPSFFWAIDQYLLTHDTFYFNDPTEISYASPPEDTATDVTGDSEDTGETTEEDSGQVDETSTETPEE